jgi:hypothetical protein
MLNLTQDKKKKELVRLYNQTGGYFFASDTMDFWESIIEFVGKIPDEETEYTILFVTSEKMYSNPNREFRLREFLPAKKAVKTLGIFDNLDDAKEKLFEEQKEIKWINS